MSLSILYVVTVLSSLLKAILPDEKIYPEPFRFNPYRFVKGDSLDEDVREQDCRPGCRYMEYESTWTNTACILAIFNVSKAKDAGGKSTPYEEYHIGFAWYFIGFPSGISS